MPTVKKRLQITLSPELDRTVSGLSKVHGKPKAAIIREFLDDAEPSLRALLRFSERYAKLEETERRAVLQGYGEVERLVEDVLGAIVRKADSGPVEDPQADARPKTARRSKVCGGTEVPPLSNRGATFGD